jgi:hypothetical protein
MVVIGGFLEVHHALLLWAASAAVTSCGTATAALRAANRVNSADNSALGDKLRGIILALTDVQDDLVVSGEQLVDP